MHLGLLGNCLVFLRPLLHYIAYRMHPPCALLSFRVMYDYITAEMERYNKTPTIGVRFWSETQAYHAQAEKGILSTKYISARAGEYKREETCM